MWMNHFFNSPSSDFNSMNGALSNYQTQKKTQNRKKKNLLMFFALYAKKQVLRIRLQEKKCGETVHNLADWQCSSSPTESGFNVSTPSQEGSPKFMRENHDVTSSSVSAGDLSNWHIPAVPPTSFSWAYWEPLWRFNRLLPGLTTWR